MNHVKIPKQLAQMYNNIYFGRCVYFTGVKLIFSNPLWCSMERIFLVQIPIGRTEIQLEEKCATFGEAICEALTLVHVITGNSNAMFIVHRR